MMGAIFLIFIISVINIFVTKSLIETLEDHGFENKILNRVFLIPPVGIATYAILVIFALLCSLYDTVRDIWR